MAVKRRISLSMRQMIFGTWMKEESSMMNYNFMKTQKDRKNSKSIHN